MLGSLARVVGPMATIAYTRVNPRLARISWRLRSPLRFRSGSVWLKSYVQGAGRSTGGCGGDGVVVLFFLYFSPPPVLPGEGWVGGSSQNAVPWKPPP